MEYDSTAISPWYTQINANSPIEEEVNRYN